MKIREDDWRRYVNTLSEINKKAGELMQKFIDTYGTDDMYRLIKYAQSLVEKYGSASGSLSCAMYDELANAQKADVPLATMAEIASEKETAGAVINSMTTNSVPDAVSRLVKLVSSDTMLTNSIRDGAEWAWISRGDTCPYCQMLASRGWVKASKKVLKGNHASHIHAHCDCEFAIRFDGESTVEGYNPQRFKRIYDNADGKTSIDKLNAIRRQMYPQIKEERNARRRHLHFLEKINDTLNDPKTNLLQNIQKGNITTKINPEKQSKHLMKSWDGKSSVFDGDLNDVQEMINHDTGSGIVYEKQDGKQYKEIIVKDYEIGYNVSEKNILNQRTDRYAIHYSKNRTHATPISPSSKKGETE